MTAGNVTSPGACAAVPSPFDAGSIVFSQLVSTLMAAQCVLSDNSAYPRDVGFHDEGFDFYDFIVVGAGSAGSVVASRLSEDERLNVLLVEAGEDPPVSAEIPYLFAALQNTPVDWAYRTEPQENACLGVLERKCRWPRGKVMGGSSTINGMLYVRGNKKDYDGWEAMGNQGWSYREVLEYFKKSEAIKTPRASSAGYHGTEGPMAVTRFGGLPEPLTSSLIAASREIGMECDDINGQNQTGFTILDSTIHKGRRVNTAKAFLVPAKDRENLHVLKGALAKRVIFDQQKRAIGLEYTKKGKTYTVSCKKEVILSAGVVNSAQLLMLSGIGPADHLAELDIPVISDLPVGHNLQDHVFTFNPTFKLYPSKEKCPSDTRLFKTCPSGRTKSLSDVDMDGSQLPPSILQNAYEYLRNRSGVWSGMGALSFNGYVSSKFADDSGEYPDLQLHFWHLSKGDVGTTKLIGDALGFDQQSVDHIFGSVLDSDILLVAPTLLRPRSTGRITLRSKDPTMAPRIEPNYLSLKREREVLVEGIKFAINFTTGTDAIGKGLCACLVRDPLPACIDREFGTDEYWECVVRHLSTTVYHHVGTNKMGPKSNGDTVVDPRLRVKDVLFLRVIDASIMPSIVSGNTNAPSIMIGEKGADMIKEEWPDD